MFLLFLISSSFLSWKDIEFCQRLFLHLLRWWCLCVVLHLLICICCTILHLWSETYLIMTYDLFNVLLDLVCNLFMENEICQGYWPLTFFFFKMYLLFKLFAGKWMEMKIIRFSEVNQAQNNKGHMISLTCRS
jgi:hypothetical protein